MENLNSLLSEAEIERQKNLLQTVQEVLSSARQMNETFKCATSSIPIHPYDLYKMQYLGPDYIPLTLESIPTPQFFCPRTCTSEISAISDEISSNCMMQLSCSDFAKFAELDGNVFTTLSATEEGPVFVVDTERTANYLKFIDVVKSIPIQAIEQNAEETAKKVISLYINLLKKK